MLACSDFSSQLQKITKGCSSYCNVGSRFPQSPIQFSRSMERYAVTVYKESLPLLTIFNLVQSSWTGFELVSQQKWQGGSGTTRWLMCSTPPPSPLPGMAGRRGTVNRLELEASGADPERIPGHRFRK